MYDQKRENIAKIDLTPSVCLYAQRNCIHGVVKKIKLLNHLLSFYHSATTQKGSSKACKTLECLECMLQSHVQSAVTNKVCTKRILGIWRQNWNYAVVY